MKEHLQDMLDDGKSDGYGPEQGGRFFLWDEELLFFPDKKALFSAAGKAVEQYNYGEWQNGVDEIYAGYLDVNGDIASVDWRVQMCEAVVRPNDDQFDEDAVDQDGFCWLGIDYICNYKLKTWSSSQKKGDQGD